MAKLGGNNGSCGIDNDAHVLVVLAIEKHQKQQEKHSTPCRPG